MTAAARTFLPVPLHFDILHAFGTDGMSMSNRTLTFATPGICIDKARALCVSWLIKSSELQGTHNPRRCCPCEMVDWSMSDIILTGYPRHFQIL